MQVCKHATMLEAMTQTDMLLVMLALQEYSTYIIVEYVLLVVVVLVLVGLVVEATLVKRQLGRNKWVNTDGCRPWV